MRSPTSGRLPLVECDEEERAFDCPEETAAAIAFLVSPEAAYIRGVSLAVDGGRLRSI